MYIYIERERGSCRIHIINTRLHDAVAPWPREVPCTSEPQGVAEAPAAAAAAASYPALTASSVDAIRETGNGYFKAG